MQLCKRLRDNSSGPVNIAQHVLVLQLSPSRFSAYKTLTRTFSPIHNFSSVTRPPIPKSPFAQILKVQNNKPNGDAEACGGTVRR